MDTMELKSKMGSAILIATASALLGACVAWFVSRRQQKPKSSQDQEDIQDSFLELKSELEDCRKTLEDFRLRLEQETERRNESEAWNRKLEQDLVDLAATRKSAEEKCVKLYRDLDIAKNKLKFAESEGKSLRIQLKNLKRSEESKIMPSATAADIIHGQKPQILPKNTTSLEQTTPGTKADEKADDNLCFTDAPASRVLEEKIHASEEERFIECGPDGKPLFDNFEDELEDEDEEDYSEEEEGCEDSDISILKTSVLDQTDDNFELGKDVMGALIASAFKDGVIESRDGDDVSLSEESHDHHVITTDAEGVNGKSDPQHGVVSQESIGDIKTTRRFWEQMIAADRPDDDDVTDEEDEVTDDDDDVTDDDDDVTDEEEEEGIHRDILHTQKDEFTKFNEQFESQTRDYMQEGQLSQTEQNPGNIIQNGNRITVNGREKKES